MSNRIDPSNPPARRGPWPQVSDLSRLYDQGAWWCMHRDAHPDANGGYPAAGHPVHDCETAHYVLGGSGDHGEGARFVEVFCAAPFLFGEPRGTSTARPTRVVLECSSDDDVETSRLVMSLGEALRLARLVEHLVDGVTFGA